MRIAMFTNNYKPFIGGVPISIERLSEDLRALGHEVYIYAPSYENMIDENYTIRVKSFKKKVNKEMVVPNIFDNTIERELVLKDFDVIHVHHPMLLGATARNLGRKYNIPVVYTYHTRYEEYLHFLKGFKALEEKEDKGYLSNGILNYSKESFIPKRIKAFVNKCDMVFAPTKTMKESLIKYGANCNIEILPTGLSEEHFKEPSLKSLKIREEILGGRSKLLCTVSRLSMEKNINFLIEGIKKVKEGYGDDFKLMVIGDGPMKEELLEKIENLKLQDNVVLLGKIPNKEIKEYYNASDLFVFSSKSETQGIVLLEAMASKLPVVALKATGVCDVVENNINGFMVEENLEVFSCNIIKVLECESLYKKLREGAGKTSLNYRGIVLAKKAAKFYENMILEKKIKEFSYGKNVG